MSPNPQKIADLVTLTEETLKGKLQFLCSNTNTFTFDIQCIHFSF